MGLLAAGWILSFFLMATYGQTVKLQQGHAVKGCFYYKNLK